MTLEKKIKGSVSDLRDRMYHRVHTNLGSPMYHTLCTVNSALYFQVKNKVHFELYKATTSNSTAGISGAVVAVTTNKILNDFNNQKSSSEMVRV